MKENYLHFDHDGGKDCESNRILLQCGQKMGSSGQNHGHILQEHIWPGEIVMNVQIFLKLHLQKVKER